MPPEQGAYLKDLRNRRDPRRAHAVVIADQDSIRGRLLGSNGDEEPRAENKGKNETYSRHAAEIIRMSVSDAAG